MGFKYKKSLCWFRRDLRCVDHAALYHALKNSTQVYCVFVFDTDILANLSDQADRRIDFIWQSVRELQQALEKLGGGLIIRHGSAIGEITDLVEELGVNALYFNHDYDPDALGRDDRIKQLLQQQGVDIHTFKDQVIFEKNEVLTQSGSAYNVFTPYKNAWLKKLDASAIQAYPVDQYISSLVPQSSPIPTLAELGFEKADLKFSTGMSGANTLFENFKQRIAHYHEWRDFPSAKGPSYLSVHLRFGTISIRALVNFALTQSGPGAQTWLSELIWRDFYQMILYHYPHVVSHAFKEKYDKIKWPGTDSHFKAWCTGQTGYPLVDAAMRQLNQTGYMHNRLRMVAASFLVKDLQVDWKKGEHYFAQKLLDYDLAANNGGWQWAASTGCDSQPWFRIFNPVTQSEKFDREGDFIRKYVPELTNCDSKAIHTPWKLSPAQQQICGITIGKDYPLPIVDHAVARDITLALFNRTG
ncbi:cryptochrome/photolyase family protein [Sulfurirhabdus autotrophica]|uniref:Deoxyribodipyrimidine photo-lyase n=1 Tax=Sulfurirhabdus autotrophica TaxID=1706046 RepID=A0A4R3YDX6_9PROT|nr:deoxyribodipyrimidine photo-lyase [Sulfurirhabdus autotrophica]TCV90266.1 deoxyribodipyrimidine photo-lyase [Sulfurirhabdus autotrophica]